MSCSWNCSWNWKFRRELFVELDGTFTGRNDPWSCSWKIPRTKQKMPDGPIFVFCSRSDSHPDGEEGVAMCALCMAQAIPGRRHHLTTTCGKLVTEAAMRSPLLVCADPARKYRCLDATSTSHGKVGLWPMHCLLCTACPPSMLFC